jgi:hypothetical protein
MNSNSNEVGTLLAKIGSKKKEERGHQIKEARHGQKED